MSLKNCSQRDPTARRTTTIRDRCSNKERILEPERRQLSGLSTSLGPTFDSDSYVFMTGSQLLHSIIRAIGMLSPVSVRVHVHSLSRRPPHTRDMRLLSPHLIYQPANGHIGLFNTLIVRPIKTCSLLHAIPVRLDGPSAVIKYWATFEPIGAKATNITKLPYIVFFVIDYFLCFFVTNQPLSLSELIIIDYSCCAAQSLNERGDHYETHFMVPDTRLPQTSRSTVGPFIDIAFIRPCLASKW
ncbi:hypothetical protein J6590_029173 [Homalodisca vitripennis]|nr:hypothetical protein J6590_029173 [Homalodisca vitripennis]